MVIHIGKGKTGTSFLQEEVFQLSSNINYIAKTEKEYPDWLIKWHYADDIFFYKIKKDIKKKLASLSHKDKVNLISSEAFSIVGNQYQQAIRIKEIEPNAKILITLRDPIDAMLSFYKYSVQHDGFIEKFEDLIDFNRIPMVFYKRKPIYLADFYYDEIIDVYKSLFGIENVCVLKFEDMIKNSNRYFTILGDFIDIDIDLEVIKNKLKKKVNSSVDESCINTIRKKNLLELILYISPSLKKEINILDIEDEVVLSDRLEKKLINELKGKCFGYY